MPRLPRPFYDRPTLDVTRDLLGQVLVHRSGRTRVSGRIVEVEAYVGEDDPACHAACGATPRNAPLYGPPGFSYVYLNYGVHCLVNVVTEKEAFPAAVLIRALEPLEGLSLMRRRRQPPGKAGSSRSVRDQDLCRGPGNLTRALGITLAENAVDLLGPTLFIEEAARIEAESVRWGPRIGIRVGLDRSWRAWIAGHPSVSGPRSSGRQPQATRRATAARVG
jgi:DNA-3-methyladenine glycosylase